MHLRWLRPALAIGLVIALGPIRPIPAQQTEEPPDPTGDAGLFGYIGGAVRAKRARTNTAATLFNESVGWLNLPNATLTYFVPAGVGTELFNVAFSAECRMVNASQFDYLRIRILHNGVPMEPYDGFQAFCSANGHATHKGNWVKRVGAGNHVLQVQFLILDAAPVAVVQAVIDDWTFETVVHD